MQNKMESNIQDVEFEEIKEDDISQSCKRH